LHLEAASAVPVEEGPSSALGPYCKAHSAVAEPLTDTSEVGAVIEENRIASLDKDQTDCYTVFLFQGRTCEVGTAAALSAVMSGFESHRRP